MSQCPHFGFGWFRRGIRPIGLSPCVGGRPPFRAVTSHAVLPGLRLEVLAVAEIDQGVEAFHAFEDDVAALAAIAAIGPAELDEFLGV